MNEQTISLSQEFKRPPSKVHEDVVIERLLKEVEFLKQQHFNKDKGDLWSNRMDESLKKFLKDDQTINTRNIANFRRVQVFLSESPTFQSLFPISWLSGRRRGQRRYGKDRLEILQKEGDTEYLKKYPINLVGNPCYFEIDGYRFNERWSRHVRYLRLAATYLGDLFASGQARVLDIGGGYGIFNGLLKREFKQVRSGLVEFPEQLLLAYYYLAMNFPSARINTLQEIHEAQVIDADFVQQYDFLLIPVHCYSKIRGGVFNLITNFTSLGEMSREWFGFYLNAPVFQKTDYLFTLNRFESRPTYNTDLNILDYKLHEFHKLHFRISPLFGRYYDRRLMFFTEQKYFTSQCFEFIGKREKWSESV